MRFNVQHLVGTPAYATLRVFSNSAANSGVGVGGAGSAWDELSLTSANAPAIGPAIASVPSLTAGTWVDFDAAPLVSGNGQVTFAITTASTVGKSFSSREGANPPQLIVGVRPPPTPTSTSTPTSTPTLTPTPEFLGLYGLDPAVYGGFDVATQYNLPTPVRMTGIDLNYKQALTFLPPWARGVQVFANASTLRATGDAAACELFAAPRAKLYLTIQ
jgi:hypothetical protein